MTFVYRNLLKIAGAASFALCFAASQEAKAVQVTFDNITDSVQTAADTTSEFTSTSTQSLSALGNTTLLASSTSAGSSLEAGGQKSLSSFSSANSAKGAGQSTANLEQTSEAGLTGATPVPEPLTVIGTLLGGAAIWRMKKFVTPETSVKS